MSNYTDIDTSTQMEHLELWIEAKMYPKRFDTSFIEDMAREGPGWTTGQEEAIDNIYTKFRVGVWARANVVEDWKGDLKLREK